MLENYIEKKLIIIILEKIKLKLNIIYLSNRKIKKEFFKFKNMKWKMKTKNNSEKKFLFYIIWTIYNIMKITW